MQTKNSEWIRTFKPCVNKNLKEDSFAALEDMLSDTNTARYQSIIADRTFQMKRITSKIRGSVKAALA
jgi:hypothetical protein